MKRTDLFLALGASLCLSLFITACASNASGSTQASTTAATETAAAESTDAAGSDMEASKSEGTAPGAPGDAPSGDMPGGNPPVGEGGGQPGGGADTMTYDYTGDLSGALSADGEAVSSDGETTESTEADVNAALAQNGGTLTITNGTLTKSGDDTNGDNCNFYGLNSIVLSVGSDSKVLLSGSTLSADSEGSNAIFATDSGTVYAYQDTIHTTAGNARGLDATYGGTVLADSMDITTEGDHCAALATDRGGGNISVTNSELNTEGSGSPLLYSTGDIEVKNVTGTASGSQIAGMEGYNTILIRNSDLTSTIATKTASDPVANGVIIYQSTSGDAESSTGETAAFQAVDSQLTSSIEEGSMFYVTNTTANIYLKNTGVNFDSDKAALLTIEGNNANNWGTEGENGGTVTFTADSETLSGDITVDTISSLDLYLLDGTTYTGAMTIKENEAAAAASDNPITVNVDGTSTWIVTEDTAVSNLNAAEGAKIVDEDGNTVTIVADGKTVVEGTGEITVTVTGSYSASVAAGTANEEKTDYIDRSGFDSTYGTSTDFAD